MYCIGIDIGGTKCAVSLADINGSNLKILKKQQISTESGIRQPQSILNELLGIINIILHEFKITNSEIHGIGISCGSPLDSKRGIILSPPNLKGWDNIKIVDFFEKNIGIKTKLQNDANACAVAEWKFGAGRGYNNLIFITFGTGFGSGLILNGCLYSGATDNAGEIGHVRLTEDGPVGYNKNGSVEGWCSGGGIAQVGCSFVESELAQGVSPNLLKKAGSIDKITAKLIADMAINENDDLCIAIYNTCAEKIGAALSIMIDIIDPEVIIMGGIYMRSSSLVEPIISKIIKKETLVQCPIIPAALGENIGDYAAAALAASI